jgi:hypothetical protein
MFEYFFCKSDERSQIISEALPFTIFNITYDLCMIAFLKEPKHAQLKSLPSLTNLVTSHIAWE